MNLDLYSADDLLLKRKALCRQLSAVENLQPVRIAVLGGSTTNEVVDLLEVLLLADGFQPVFHQSEYGRFYEDAVLDSGDLVAFAPDIVYLHTSHLNVLSTPPVNCSEDDFEAHVDAEMERYWQIWRSLEQRLSTQIVQNNFDLPPLALLGNLDSVSSGGRSRFFLELNARFARAAAANPSLLLHDLHRVAAQIGLDRWFDWNRWFSYKILMTPAANLAVARSLTAMVRGLYGRSRKVLVLDLDNTLWGGVIGDDGIEKIRIGRETPLAEAYTAFQEYCLALHSRGVLLAVCSKNDEEIAKQGFEHPDSVLKLEHISSFKANWEPKHENILAIARELNLGIDSFVYADDNPAERALVEAQLPGIAVPDLGQDVARFAAAIDAGRYFEPVSLSQEDLARPGLYRANSARATLEAKFANYGEYLDSLEMSAEVARFTPLYLERIAQLTNKTNQFNLTTRRYTLSEIEAIACDPRYIGLYGRLSDRFGDNGLISVVLGRREGDVLHLDLWLMSCRVLKRNMEQVMLDALVAEARAAGVATLRGYYAPTKKNGMVADHYRNLGFDPLEKTNPSADTSGTPCAHPCAASVWTLAVAAYTSRNRHIRVPETVHG